MPIHSHQLAAARRGVHAVLAPRAADWAGEAERHRRLARACLQRIAGHRRWLAAASARDPQLAAFYRLTRPETEAALAAARRHRMLGEACAARAAGEDRAVAMAKAA